MRKFFLFAIIALTLCSCSKKPTAIINGTIVGAGDSTKIVLNRYYINRVEPVDTIITDAKGQFSYKVKLPNESPNFYYIYNSDNIALAGMVLFPNDNVEVAVNSEGEYAITGSPESLLLKEATETFINADIKLSSLAEQIAETKDPAKIKELNSEMGKTYIDYKRWATARIISNPYSPSSSTILFQKFNGILPVFGELNDVFLFMRVCDSLKTVYPDSELIGVLAHEVSNRKERYEMLRKVNDAQTVSFPDLIMPDINGTSQQLSSLRGKVILLSFWSVSQADHKMFNNDLLEIYGKYHDKGFEIYQVALDIDKPTWAAAVKAQKLPWISVNDGLGQNSTSVSSYNITAIPAMFIINKDGDIVERDIFEKGKLEKAIEKLL